MQSKKANQIANQATAHNISLPYDDPFDLLVHPDGSWQLIVLDIDNEIVEDTLEKHNRYLVPRFLGPFKSSEANFRKLKLV